MKKLGIALWLLLLIIFIFGQGSYALNVTHSLEREIVPFPIMNEYKYDFWFNQFSIEFDIPKGLLKEISRHETGGSFYKNIIGCTGDLGLMQLNPKYIESYFADLDRIYKGYYTNGVWFDWELPSHNIMLGAFILSQNYKYFGDWDKAISAYNRGISKTNKIGIYWEYRNKIDWSE